MEAAEVVEDRHRDHRLDREAYLASSVVEVKGLDLDWVVVAVAKVALDSVVEEAEILGPRARHSNGVDPP